jgi:hypothetical protein
MGWLVQLGATALTIGALMLVGVWILPPWWSPYLYATLLLGGIVVTRRVAIQAARWPNSVGGWLSLATLAALGAMATAVIGAAITGHRPPAGAVAELEFPLGEGHYLVVNGGNHLLVNAHLKTLDTTVARFRPWLGNSHGVDLVRIGDFGLPSTGVLPADPSRYHIWNAEVLAPCGGTVIAAVDGTPDFRVPEKDLVNRAGNHLNLECSALHVVLAHFRSGSVAVRVGDIVSVGQVLARAGNSGATDMPHLHIHAQRPGTAEHPMSGTPVPARLGGRYLVRGDRARKQW